MQAVRGSAPSSGRTNRSQETYLDEQAPLPLEAARALEEIIAHLPGEARESLLVLAEEHGVPRSEGEAVLVLLEQHGRVKRTTGSVGVERWEPALQENACTRSHVAGERGALPVYSRNDLAEQRWKLVQSGVLCPTCGLVRVATG